jgi:hypothetical protein
LPPSQRSAQPESFVGRLADIDPLHVLDGEALRRLWNPGAPA